MRTAKLLAASTLVASLFTVNSVLAETHTVTAEGMSFNPLVVHIEPGDTVAWENMPTHNVEMIEGLIPEGAEAFMTPMGDNYRHTFEKEGVYIYICTPHIGVAMGGAVVVGEPTNLDVIKAADESGGLGRVIRQALAEIE